MESPRPDVATDALERRLAQVEADLAKAPAGVAQSKTTALADRALKLLPLLIFSNLLVAAPAFLISLAVAYFSFVQAEATQKLQVASVWPHVAYETSNQTEEGQDKITMSLANKGVGPAMIRGMEIRYREKPYREFRQILGACCSDSPDSLLLGTGGINGEVMQSGERMMFAQMRPDGNPAETYHSFNRERMNIQVKVCYCSVFEDCWVVDWNSSNPKPVKQCPADWVQYYGFPQPEPDR